MSTRQYFKLYVEFLKQAVKVWMEYRGDFFIGALSTFTIQGAAILFIAVVFGQIHQLNGWSFSQMLFMFGIANTGRSIHMLFFDNLWTLGWQYIKTGDFDRILIRPINPLFHVIADRVQQDGVGQFLLGLIILVESVRPAHIHWSVLNVILLIVMIVSSGLIFSAVNLFLATLSFWMVDSLPIMSAVFNLSDFARYPLSIYNKSIRVILTWIIPYGFTAFYPASYFFGGRGYTLVASMTPLVAVLCCLVAYYFWTCGIRAYSSTGT